MFHIMKEPLRKQSVSTYATFDSEDPKMVTLQSDQNNLVIKRVTWFVNERTLDDWSRNLAIIYIFNGSPLLE